MDLKGFFQRNWIYLAMIGAILIVLAVFFKPQFDGYAVKQHDIKEGLGMGNETNLFREATGEEPKWTSSAFGGMPTEQISMLNPGNWFKTILNGFFSIFQGPLGLIFLHFLCFLVFARLLKIKPLIGLLGAIAFSFASYELIVIQAGHVAKSGAAAFLPAILGAFIYAFRTNRKWGIILAGIFMTFELEMNHVQVTYYFLFVLLFVGIYLFVEAVKNKEIKKFVITAAGIIGVFIIAFAINSSNIILSNDYAKVSIRGANDISITPDGLPSKIQSSGLDRDYITQWSYGVDETFTLISPYVKGSASEPIGLSPFAEKIENGDFTEDQKKTIFEGNSYWGTQPITSGPVYLGIIVCLLAFLGLFFLKDKIKWPLFAITVLAIFLSWGKNFMGLTNFFIDHVPAYNKFRAVTIILVIVELTIPIMGVLFLNELVKQREAIIAQKRKFLAVLGGFVLFLIVLRVVGLGDNYTNPAEANQYAGLTVEEMSKQIMQLDPQMAAQQYQLDLSNPQQVQQFAQMQVDSRIEQYSALKEARKVIFSSSMNRSILFSILAAGLFLVFLYSKSEKSATSILIGGLVVLTLADMVPVAYNYLGGIETPTGDLKYWEEKSVSAYPISTTKGDEEVMAAELAENPGLAAVVKKGESLGRAKADELGYDGIARSNVINSYRFHALTMATNYRVLDFAGAFNSSRASYFHKSLGGYHGAKLRNISNLIDFHISKSNNRVLDMLNVKYFLQSDQQGLDTAIYNRTALGNAWLVKSVKEFSSPNDEIRALGNKFRLENRGPGILLVNGMPTKKAGIFGGEDLKYLLQGKDTIPVQLANGLSKGQDAMFVIDVRGTTNLVPLMTLEADTAKSFTPLVYMNVESSFDPKNEAVMLNSFAKNLSAKKFSADGYVKLEKSVPNKLTYTAEVKGNQLAVFSEIYYPIGWKAFVDNKEVPILKVNYLLRALELKDGHHKIEFVYDLPKYYTTNMIARVGSIILFVLLGIALYTDFRNRRKEKNVVKQ
ncbi:MAG: hypothetical protein K0S23_1629 [Fluviicola sp.]|jgi:hypothetical protein|uniref:YfhO family protein n=1 Tax=Fluviicola sp. TaxID=1917219 RepID=UPI00261B3EFF|nr:YfhO family protein [Fluviicola sp.]MDF3027322.1 hypothetical protein [Fluviicola sp.]